MSVLETRAGWDALARTGCDSSRPYGVREFAAAARYLDDLGWLRLDEPGRVLCLATGGGQQSALFASLGWAVTVADVSPGQLALDHSTATRFGFDVECVATGMDDLSALRGRTFDLVYQPVSLVYVPDPHRVFREVASVLARGGGYWSEQWNPEHMALTRPGPWPRRWDGCWHHRHDLADLLDGPGRAGLALDRVATRLAPGQPPSAAVPAFLLLLARRR